MSSASKDVDIAGLDKITLMLAMYESANKSLFDAGWLSAEQARWLYEQEGGSFDYVNGRCFKCDISGDLVNPSGYDRDAGQGRLQEVVTTLRHNISKS